MAVRLLLTLLLLVGFCSVSHAKEERWVKFAQDADLSYYIDDRSVVALPDNVFIFWVKSVARDREYFKNEYGVENVSYVLNNYEVDCALSSYRLRGTIMFDKNRREISKNVPIAPPAFEPVPPESVIELAEEELCRNVQNAPKPAKEEETAPAAPATPAEPPSIQ